MASRRLAEMDFDEFVDNGFENESLDSTVESDQNASTDKSVSKVKKHKQSLLSLSQDDPEFYEFLLENDKELLEFSDGDSDCLFSDSNSGDGEFESVSDTGSETGDDVSMDVGSEVISDNDDVEPDPKNIVTKDEVKFLRKALKTKNSISAFRRATFLFHIAVHQVAGEEIDSSLKLHFEKVTIFNELVICCLECFPVFLQNQLISSNDTIIIRGKKCKKNWSKIRENVKDYLSDILFTLAKLVEPSLLCTILISIKPLICLFIEFQGLRKNYAKILIKLWSKDERSVQLQSFLCMKGLILFANSSLFNYLLKRTYLSYVQSTKFSTELNKEYIAFLTDSLVAIYSVDLARSYQLAFVYIRQLAVHLRNALTSKTDETTQLVYNWQFIHSIEFWCKLLSTEGAMDTHLKQLIFPLVQVTLGAISLNPIAKFYPLRIRCIRSLNLLALHTNTYIPLAKYILEILDYVCPHTIYTHMPPKPPNFAYILKVAKQFMRTKHFHDYLVEVAFELLLEHLSSYEHSIAFPEMSFPILRELKKFSKDTFNSKHRREIKSLAEKMGMQSKFIEEARNNVDFAPKDMNKVREWESTFAMKQSHINSYLIMWRKSINLRDDATNGDVPDGVKKEKVKSTSVAKKKRDIPSEQTSISNTGLEAEVEDTVTDMSIAQWDD